MSGTVIRKINIIIWSFFLMQVAIPLFSQNLIADEWPTFQHDNQRLGYSTCEVPDVAHQNWSLELDYWVGSPMIADGKVFLIANKTLLAIDINTKKILWEFNKDCWDSGLAGIMDDMIFVGSGKIYGLDLDTGDIVWESENGTSAKIVTSSYVFTSKIMSTQNDYTHIFYSLYKSNGSIKWTYNITRKYNSRIKTAFHDNILFITLGYPYSTVYAINTNNGNLLWKRSVQSTVGCAPTIYNGVVYVTSYEGLYALDEYGNGDGTTDILWSFDYEGYTRGSVAIANDMIFFGTTNFEFWALDANPSDGIDEGITDPDGSEYDVIWKGYAGPIEDGSPVFGDGKVIVQSDSGNFYVLNASNGEKIWGGILPEQSFPPTPAIVYDMLFVSGGNTLYVFSLNQKPIANFVCNKLVGNITTKFEFNASDSYDPDGLLIYWNWEFGDGTTGWGENVSHIFGDDGTYEVSFTVTDNDRVRSNRISVIIIIQNLPPVANFSANRTQIKEGEAIEFDASASYDVDDSNLNYSWEFGDGNVLHGVKIIHNFSREGAYVVALTVTDDDGDNDTYYITIDVFKNNRAHEEKRDLPSSLWNNILPSVIIIVIIIILVFLLVKHIEKEEENFNHNEPIIPPSNEISCPDCNYVFEVPTESRPLKVECPNCGTKGTIK